ncbi:MAG: hypothetical protein ACREBS_01445 [Nitrososphaerales archaeon]
MSSKLNEKNHTLAPDHSPSSASDFDSVLVGLTLRVYKLLLTSKKALSAREIQKELRLSTPSLAVFHLDKLERAGLIAKTEDGSGCYFIEKLYLKHYFRLRRFLIPRYVFHSVLATFFLVGWVFLLIIIYFAPNNLISASRTPALATNVLLTYGIIAGIITACLFWFESIRVLRQDKI